MSRVYCTPEEQARLWLSHNGYRTLAGGCEYVSGRPLYEIMAQYHEWMKQAEKRDDGAEPDSTLVTASENTEKDSSLAESVEMGKVNSVHCYFCGDLATACQENCGGWEYSRRKLGPPIPPRFFSCCGAKLEGSHIATCKREVFEKPSEGEWVQPIESDYRMRCCDCGLTHRMDFRVYEGRAQFRVFREASPPQPSGDSTQPHNEPKENQ